MEFSYIKTEDGPVYLGDKEKTSVEICALLGFYTA
jgi:hypothetical protein